LEKKSGKKCYMLSARDLIIVWGDTPTYWKWNSDPSSRLVCLSFFFTSQDIVFFFW
jgi:hypothetical protein